MKISNKLKKGILVTLCLSILAGCGSSSSNGSSGDGSDTIALDIHFHSGNKYTLNDSDGNLLPVFQLAADKTGVIVNSTANPSAKKSEDEFQLQATEGFPGDIYGGSNVRTPIYDYATQGAFLPLNDLIDEHAPNVKAYLEENPDVRRALTAPDGNIYMLAYVPDGLVGRTYFMRTDWLEQLNLETPTTLEGLETVLRAFRDDDPNGNGQQDEVPAFNEKGEELIRLVNLWGARCYGADSNKERYILNEDGTFYDAWIQPAFKDGVAGLAKWYDEKLIDQEAFTREQNKARGQFFTKDNTGAFTHEWLASTTSYNHNAELRANVPDFKIEAMLPPSTPLGKGFAEHRRMDVKPDGWAISAKSKNAEAAIRYMDFFFSEEGNRAINFGIEGSSYTMVDGKPVFTDEVLQSGEVNKHLYETYGAQLPIGYAMDYAYEYQWTSEEGRAAYDLYENSDVFDEVLMTPSLTFTEEESAVRMEVMSPLQTYQMEMIQAFITGRTDITAEWDNYVEKCKALGSDKMVAIYESAYKRFEGGQ